MARVVKNALSFGVTVDADKAAASLGTLNKAFDSASTKATSFAQSIAAAESKITTDVGKAAAELLRLTEQMHKAYTERAQAAAEAAALEKRTAEAARTALDQFTISTHHATAAVQQSTIATQQFGAALDAAGVRQERNHKRTQTSAEGFANLSAKVNAASVVLNKLGEVIKGVAHEYMIAEKAAREMEGGLTAHGILTAENKQRNEEYAKSLERRMGLDADDILSMRAKLLLLGVLPENLDAASNATIGWARIMGKDLLTAAHDIDKAIHGNVRIFKAFNAALKTPQDVFDFTRRGMYLLEQDAESLEGKVRAADLAWGEFQENLGNLMDTPQSQNALVLMSDGLRELARLLKENKDLIGDFLNLKTIGTGTVGALLGGLAGGAASLAGAVGTGLVASTGIGAALGAAGAGLVYVLATTDPGAVEREAEAVIMAQHLKATRDAQERADKALLAIPPPQEFDITPGGFRIPRELTPEQRDALEEWKEAAQRQLERDALTASIRMPGDPTAGQMLRVNMSPLMYPLPDEAAASTDFFDTKIKVDQEAEDKRKKREDTERRRREAEARRQEQAYQAVLARERKALRDKEAREVLAFEAMGKDESLGFDEAVKRAMKATRLEVDLAADRVTDFHRKLEDAREELARLMAAAGVAPGVIASEIQNPEFNPWLAQMIKEKDKSPGEAIAEKVIAEKQASDIAQLKIQQEAAEARFKANAPKYNLGGYFVGPPKPGEGKSSAEQVDAERQTIMEAIKVKEQADKEYLQSRKELEEEAARSYVEILKGFTFKGADIMVAGFIDGFDKVEERFGKMIAEMLVKLAAVAIANAIAAGSGSAASAGAPAQAGMGMGDFLPQLGGAGGAAAVAVGAGAVLSAIFGDDDTKEDKKKYVRQRPKGFATGGLVVGEEGYDANLVRLTKGEYVLSVPVVNAIKKGMSLPYPTPENRVERHQPGGTTLNVNISSSIPASRSEMERHLSRDVMPALRRLQKRGF